MKRRPMFDFGIRRVTYHRPDSITVRFRWWRRRHYWRMGRTDSWRSVHVYPGFKDIDL